MASGAASVARRQAVGQDEPALGVGVEHLDGLAVADGEHVADAGGVAAGHVVGERQEAEHAHLGAERGDGPERAEHGGAAAHVALHADHAVGRS